MEGWHSKKEALGDATCLHHDFCYTLAYIHMQYIPALFYIYHSAYILFASCVHSFPGFVPIEIVSRLSDCLSDCFWNVLTSSRCKSAKCCLSPPAYAHACSHATRRHNSPAPLPLAMGLKNGVSSPRRPPEMVVHAWYPDGVPNTHSSDAAASSRPKPRTCRRNARRRSDRRRSGRRPRSPSQMLAAAALRSREGRCRMFANTYLYAHTHYAYACTRTADPHTHTSLYSRTMVYMHYMPTCACMLPPHTCTHAASIHVHLLLDYFLDVRYIRCACAHT